MEAIRQLIHEIHRRSLWQVLGIYVVASGAVLGSVARWLTCVGLFTLVLLTAPDSLQAQASLPDSVVQGADDSGERRGSRVILGKTTDRRRFIPGVWAMHPFLPRFPELDPMSGVAIQFSTWVFATFINSYHKRSFLVAVERNWIVGDWRALRFGAGFRAGLIAGYDERLFELARHTPVLPFGGLLVWSQLGPVGVDAFYVYRAITLEASFEF